MLALHAEFLRDRARPWFGLLLMATAAACAAPAGGVSRIARGIEYSGREISDAAYANYTRGAVWEAEGRLKEALAAYSAALDEDPEAPEILARLGAVRCRLGRDRDDPLRRRGLSDLERALRWDPDSALVFEELARCRSLNGEKELALNAALEAVRRDPEAEKLSLLVAHSAEAAGNTGLARAWLDATVTWHPNSMDAWVVFGRFASQHDDPIRSLRAQRALERLGRASSANAHHAELRGDPRRLPPLKPTAAAPAEVFRVPTESAARAFAANPDDTEAWVTLLVAADLEQRTEDFQELLRAAPSEPGPLSPVAAQSFAELLERWLGPSARQAWEASRSASRKPGP